MDGSLNNFVTTSRNLSETCEFDILRVSLIRDIIICDINNNKLREGAKQNITLERVIQLGQVAEHANLHEKQLWNEEKLVNQVTRKHKVLIKDFSVINNRKFCGGRKPTLWKSTI